MAEYTNDIAMTMEEVVEDVEVVAPWMELTNEALSAFLGFLGGEDLARTMSTSMRMWGVSSNERLWFRLLNKLSSGWESCIRDDVYSTRGSDAWRIFYQRVWCLRCHCCGRPCTKKTQLGRVGLDALQSLRLRICTKCQPEHLVTRSAAKATFMLTEKLLTTLHYTSRRWFGKECRLYRREHVINLSLKRWKTQDAVDAERRRRKIKASPALPPWQRLKEFSNPPAAKSTPKTNTSPDASDSFPCEAEWMLDLGLPFIVPVGNLSDPTSSPTTSPSLPSRRSSIVVPPIAWHFEDFSEVMHQSEGIDNAAGMNDVNTRYHAPKNWNASDMFA